jgi:hypothetical protein
MKVREFLQTRFSFEKELMTRIDWK